jgi:hypothetical protein
MELKLKPHKLGTIIECGCYIFFLLLIPFILYLRFFTDSFYNKVVLERSSKYLDYFFYYHPYYALLVCVMIIVGLCWMLKKCLVYLYKGYIAQVSPEGIMLTYGRVIPWHDIECIDSFTTFGRFTTYIHVYTKPVQSKNFIDFVIKRLHRSVLLSNFDRAEEACRLLREYWEQYQ